MLPNEGTYRAKLGGQIVVYEAEKTGSLCAAIPVMIAGDDWQYACKHTMVLVKGDGTVMTRTVDTLKKVFGWDGADPFWLADTDLSECEFDVVCVHEQYAPEDGSEPRMVFKIKWLNPPGEGGGAMPEPADRKSVLAKYGAKFRALAGGTKPAQPKPAASASPTPAQASATTAPASSGPTSKSKSPGPPKPAKKPASTAGGQAPTATMEEAWQTLVKLRPDDDEEALGVLWYAKLEELFPGKSNTDFSIQDWGKVKAAFES